MRVGRIAGVIRRCFATCERVTSLWSARWSSRLWRNAQDAGRDVAVMEGKGCELMVWNEGIDTSTAFGRAAFTIMAAVSQLESDTISDRVKRAHAVAKKAGRKGPGRRPYGWKVSPEGQLGRDAEEQRNIDLVVGLRGQGQPWGKIAGLLNSAGSVGVSGVAWSEGGLRLVIESAVSRRLAEAGAAAPASG